MTHQTPWEILLFQIHDRDRMIFDRYYGQQLQDARAADLAAHAGEDGYALDVDAVESALLQRLLDDAYGRNPDGLCHVPTLREVWTIPPLPEDRPGGAATVLAPAPRARGAVTLQQLRLPGAVAAVGLLLFALFWPSAPAPAKTTATTATPDTPVAAAAANVAAALPTTAPITGVVQAAVTPISEDAPELKLSFSDPTTVEITAADGQQTSLRVTPSEVKLGHTWAPGLSAGAAAWLKGTYVNTVLCVDAAQHAGLLRTAAEGQGITLRLASTAIRRYDPLRLRLLSRQQTEALDQNRVGLTLIACNAAPAPALLPDETVTPDSRLVLEAVYRPAAVPGDRPAPGTAVNVGDLLRAEVLGVSAEHPTAAMAPGSAAVAVRVRVTNLQDLPIRWETTGDQLEVQGGIAERLSRPVEPLHGGETRELEFRYLAPGGGGAAAWHLLAPDGAQASFSLSAPAAPLPGAQLEVDLPTERVQILDGPSGRQLVFELRFNNPTDQPVALDSLPLVALDGGMARAPLTPLPPLIPARTALTHLVATEAPEAKTFIVKLGDSFGWYVRMP